MLPRQHAYSHVNALCSAMQCYLTDGSEKHFAAAKNGFQFVREQSFATGGWGPDEGFQVPGTDALVKTLESTHNSFETPCGAYGHFKIARYLMRATGDASYGDSMEAVLYNTILGARPIRPDGVSFYYADYNNKATKVDYDQKWPCCSGTFPQLTADYGISSYLRAPKGIYVNLYVPSRVTWNQGGARVTLTQTTQYPMAEDTTLRLQMDKASLFTVALRIPAWAGPRTAVRVNGKPAAITVRQGAWAEITREWRSGDWVELSLSMPLQLLPIDPQHPDTVALVSGPLALFAIGADERKLTRQQLLAARKVTGTGDWIVATSRGNMMMRPYSAIQTEHYRLYHEV